MGMGICNIIYSMHNMNFVLGLSIKLPDIYHLLSNAKTTGLSGPIVAFVIVPMSPLRFLSL